MTQTTRPEYAIDFSRRSARRGERYDVIAYGRDDGEPLPFSYSQGGRTSQERREPARIETNRVYLQGRIL